MKRPSTGFEKKALAPLQKKLAVWLLKGGMCATCKAKVLCGEVRMTKNYALTAEELDEGYILTCQAHPLGDVAITYDVHGGVGR